jgi:pimeloyl-ACP methyl ester carboxylesterase
VLLLPGAVLPADLAYGDLVTSLGSGVDAVTKDLELYATDEPPAGYSLDLEIDGALRVADARGWTSFHVVGYSAGGAAALALTARHPQRILSLGLLEPAWAGNWDLSPAEAALWESQKRIADLPAEEFMPAFVRLALKPGVPPPERPPGEPPPWMAKRPAGIDALIRAFGTYELDRGSLHGFSRPVYFALGALSNPDQYEEIATRLAGVFADFELETFEARHHFDPPHRTEPDRLAQSLLALWSRAETCAQPDR